MSTRRRRPAVLQRPEQGWSSLLLMLGLLFMLGLSIADSRSPALGVAGESPATVLIVVMLAAGLIGFVLARSSLGVVRAHLLGAAAAVFVLLMVAGTVRLEGLSPMPLSLEGLTDRVSVVWIQLESDVTEYLQGDIATPPMATFLVLGAICWTTAQFSAFSIFRYDRGGPAVMAIGAVLFLNVGLGSVAPAADLLPVVPLLAAFSALAMLLLMRLQLTQQRQRWARRHIADSGEVTRLFLRSGVLFVALTVLSASSLTVWATVDKQEVDFGSLEQPLDDIGEELSRWLGILGVPPPETTITTVGDTWTVAEVWDQPNGVAFRAGVEGQLRGNYWWGWAHDEFDGRTWDRQKLESVEVPAGEPVPVSQLASAGGKHLATAGIISRAAAQRQGMLFRPAEAGVVDRDIVAHVVDKGDGIGDITFDEELEVGDGVTVDAWVRDYSRDASSLTANALQGAGTDYPDWVTDRYLQGTEVEYAGERARELAAKIKDRFDNPYDRAVEIQNRLQRMKYTPNMRNVCDGEEPIPECVLREERGFCQHYATTMAMVLRGMDIPSRVITGYLSGERVDEEWVVEQAAFHNWVEAWFPGYGWVRFDPTPRDEFGMAPTALPEGPVTPSGAEPSPSATSPAETPEPVIPEETPGLEGAGSMGPAPTDESTSTLLLGAGLALLLSIGVAGLLLFRFRRLSEPDGGVAYRGIVSLATRLGYGPHPSQTEYEYAGALSETLPDVRDDLYLVAGARVEKAYGQRQIEGRRRGALRRAYARIRTALLRLSLRRR